MPAQKRGLFRLKADEEQAPKHGLFITTGPPGAAANTRGYAPHCAGCEQHDISLRLVVARNILTITQRTPYYYDAIFIRNVYTMTGKSYIVCNLTIRRFC